MRSRAGPRHRGRGADACDRTGKGEVSVKRTIRLRGLNGAVKGQTWESTDLLRVGRLDPLEIVLDDSSVSRYHAEIRATDRGWRVRDLGSTNGTRLNGVRLGNGQWPLRPRDLLQFGEVAVVVEARRGRGRAGRPRAGRPTTACASRARPSRPGTRPSQGLAFDSNRSPPRRRAAPGPAAGRPSPRPHREGRRPSPVDPARRRRRARRPARRHRAGRRAREQAQAQGPRHRPRRAARHGRRPRRAGGRFQFSQSLANRCVSRGESILCHSVEEDPELAMAKSIAEGTMASVLCVLLRTPRKRLGVLHLDRSPWQKPFTMDDLHLADALAANVSAGIECAQLLRKQRDLFLDTITILAQAVEMRDEYTGGHTCRVTTYSLLLAEQLDMSAGRHGPDPHRHAAARHRQDRHRRRHPAQAGQADAGRVRRS